MSATNTLATNGIERTNLQSLPGAQPVHPNGTRRFEQDAPADMPSSKTKRLPTRKQAILGVLILVVGIVTVKLAYNWWTVGRFIQNTDDAYIGGDVTVIAPEVAGFIAKLAVSDNQQVHAGDLLITLDGRDYRAALAKADAAVAIQQATLTNLDATRKLQEAIVTQAQADITAADAQTVRTLDDQVRFKKLAANGTEPVQSFEHADADYKQAVASAQKAQAGLVAAQQQLQVIETQKLEAQASLQQAIAEEETARLNLGYTELRAPIDGTVGNRSAQVGAYATAGSQLISLIPTHGLWVDANYKEDQLARIHPGSPATVKVDSIPGKIFHGHVVSIAPATGAEFSVLPPENATGNFTKIVQRVTIRIQLDDEDAALGQLRPGLSVTAKVDTKGNAGL